MLGTLITQVASGGSPPEVLALFLAQGVAIVLAVAVAARALLNYGRTDGAAMLYVALGIVLVAVVPTVLGFVLPTFTAATALESTVATNTSEMLGLLALLYAVYGDHRS